MMYRGTQPTTSSITSPQISVRFTKSCQTLPLKHRFEVLVLYLNISFCYFILHHILEANIVLFTPLHLFDGLSYKRLGRFGLLIRSRNEKWLGIIMDQSTPAFFISETKMSSVFSSCHIWYGSFCTFTFGTLSRYWCGNFCTQASCYFDPSFRVLPSLRPRQHKDGDTLYHGWTFPSWSLILRPLWDYGSVFCVALYRHIFYRTLVVLACWRLAADRILIVSFFQWTYCKHIYISDLTSALFIYLFLFWESLLRMYL